MNITYSDHNKEFLHVVGDRPKHSVFINKIGGRWNKKLEPPGWILNNIFKKDLDTYIKNFELKQIKKNKNKKNKDESSEGGPQISNPTGGDATKRGGSNNEKNKESTIEKNPISALLPIINNDSSQKSKKAASKILVKPNPNHDSDLMSVKSNPNHDSDLRSVKSNPNRDSDLRSVKSIINKEAASGGSDSVKQAPVTQRSCVPLRGTQSDRGAAAASGGDVVDAAPFGGETPNSDRVLGTRSPEEAAPRSPDYDIDESEKGSEYDDGNDNNRSDDYDSENGVLDYPRIGTPVPHRVTGGPLSGTRVAEAGSRAVDDDSPEESESDNEIRSVSTVGLHSVKQARPLHGVQSSRPTGGRAVGDLSSSYNRTRGGDRGAASAFGGDYNKTFDNENQYSQRSGGRQMRLPTAHPRETPPSEAASERSRPQGATSERSSSSEDGNGVYYGKKNSSKEYKDSSTSKLIKEASSTRRSIASFGGDLDFGPSTSSRSRVTEAGRRAVGLAASEGGENYNKRCDKCNRKIKKNKGGDRGAASTFGSDRESTASFKQEIKIDRNIIGTPPVSKFLYNGNKKKIYKSPAKSPNIFKNSNVYSYYNNNPVTKKKLYENLYKYNKGLSFPDSETEEDSEFDYESD